MIRVKLSEHSNWPTIPQLFVKGELIGGADITKEPMKMDRSLIFLIRLNSKIKSLIKNELDKAFL